MKTTIDIPETLYKRVKIRAVERGQTLKQIVLTSLQREMDSPAAEIPSAKPSWANRELLPEFKRLSDAGLMRLSPARRSIDDMISDIKVDPEL